MTDETTKCSKCVRIVEFMSLMRFIVYVNWYVLNERQKRKNSKNNLILSGPIMMHR